MCTLYAFKTRNVPENFNEAKFIGFTMYTTLVIWIAFVVIYLSSDHKVTTLSLCISFSALFALFLLFFPRCYIILFKPEKNNRSYFTTIKNVRCHIGYQLGGSGSGSANSAANTANNNAANEKTTNSINSHQHSTHHQEQPFLVPSATLGANSKLAHFEEQLQRQLNEQDFNFLDAFDSQDELELNCQEGSETAATDRHQRKR